MSSRPILLAAAVGLGLLCQSNAGAQAPAAPTAGAVPAAGDPAKGADIFNANCSTCHSTAKTSADSTSLSLFGVVGRKSGSNADFSYSPAMQAAGVTWTPDKLDAYIANPSAVVPGNIMYFPGLPDAADRANVIAYLATLK